MNRCPSMLLLVCVLVAGPAQADWPQFQGPNRTGMSDETGLARTWPASGPKVLWTVSVGKGFAGPAIVDGKVYLLDRVQGKKDVLRCLDLTSGKELATLEFESPGYSPSKGYDGSRSAPTVDSKRIYVVGQMGDFYCVDRAVTKLLWRKNLLKDFGRNRIPMWGVSQAPVLYKDMVIVAAQSPKAGVVALKQDSGSVVWQSDKLPGGAGYSSPALARIGGVDHVLMVSATPRKGNITGAVLGLSAKDGKVLWTYDGWKCGLPIPFPTSIGDGRLFITGGYKAGSAMIRVTQKDGAFSAQELFKLDYKKCGSQIHQPILCQDHLYVNSNSNEQTHGLICLTLDGEVLWRSIDAGGPRLERGNLLIADGLIFDLDGATGVLYMVEPNASGYKELAKASIFRFDAGAKTAQAQRSKSRRRRRRRPMPKIWAPMAVADGKLVLRDQKVMKCLDLRNP